MWSNKLALKSSTGFHKVVEEALQEERAGALGRAGRTLEEAIDDHRLLVEVGQAGPEEIRLALDAVADAAWKLMVQRECCGFRKDNVGWMRRHYAIPAEVLHRL